MTSSALRLGLYVDGPYRLGGVNGALRVAPDPADLPFVTFACAVAAHFREQMLFARSKPATGLEEWQVLPAGLGVAPLPDYGELRAVRGVVRALAGTMRGFWLGLRQTDVVLVFGPHPFGVVLVLLALLRRKSVVLGIRQDTLAYYRGRLPSGRWKPFLALVWALDGTYRLLARRLPTIVVGPEIERHYGGPRARLLPLTVSLVPAADIVAEPLERDWDGEITLLTVGRIEREKNPLLVADLLAELERRRPGRYRLAWAGTGDLAEAVTARAAELGVSNRLELLGFVPFGSELLGHYRAAHVFVHVSLTEGVPQVLVEALASSTPVVATDVGGVRSGLAGGEAGLLVRAGDAQALADAIVRLDDDPALRQSLVLRGLELARTLSREAQAERAAAFVDLHSAA